MKNTPQTKLVLDALRRQGHATNQDLYSAVKNDLPDISVTSVHRITSRLVGEKIVGTAPDRDGVTILDIRPEPHHHFVCHTCGKIRDITLPEGAINAIQAQLPHELVDGGLAVHGSCKCCDPKKVS